MSGSSPRSWGTLTKPQQQFVDWRFIPTVVGNTPSVPLTEICASVHPHGRGEHWACMHALDHEPGSSPRSWGTPVCSGTLFDHIRFIPTVVGNTPPASVASFFISVHPHGRGEHMTRDLGTILPLGSSPRSWGTLSLSQPKQWLRRFIPTVVGNTVRLPAPIYRRPVHPHGRGEHYWSEHCEQGFFGSSPRSWGTRDRIGQRGVGARFIPTVVGNT